MIDENKIELTCNQQKEPCINIYDIYVHQWN